MQDPLPQSSRDSVTATKPCTNQNMRHAVPHTYRDKSHQTNHCQFSDQDGTCCRHAVPSKTTPSLPSSYVQLPLSDSQSAITRMLHRGNLEPIHGLDHLTFLAPSSTFPSNNPSPPQTTTTPLPRTNNCPAAKSRHATSLQPQNQRHTRTFDLHRAHRLKARVIPQQAHAPARPSSNGDARANTHRSFTAPLRNGFNPTKTPPLSPRQLRARC